MQEAEREELERAIRALCEAKDHDAAVQAALEGYGAEVLRFLYAFHRSEEAASEVFSLFAEGLWRGIGGFGWQCSFRTWAYGVARKSSLRFRRDERRRERRLVPFPESSELWRIEQQVRSATLTYLRTERRSRFAAIRDALPPEDRELLILRVDRQLAWNDLARALHDDEAGPLLEEDVKREAARLRKRFQLLKERLSEIGRREGLLGDKGDDRKE